MGKNIEFHEIDALRDLFIGHTVVKVSDDELRLDDGRVLKLVPNCGGCSCGAGDYELTALNDCPVNAIMNVEVIDEDAAGTSYDDDTTYRLFILAQDERIELATFEGNDGNGYYGTGFWVEVTNPTK